MNEELRMDRQRGFTMIELLVVVSLIGILSALGISTFLGGQRYNRDQKRVRDLQTVKQALELYRSDNGSYPQTWDMTSENLSFGSKVYMEASAGAVPKDPITGQNYVYYKASTGNNFVLCAKKEGNASLGLPVECTSSGLSCAGGINDCDIGVASD